MLDASGEDEYNSGRVSAAAAARISSLSRGAPPTPTKRLKASRPARKNKPVISAMRKTRDEILDSAQLLCLIQAGSRMATGMAVPAKRTEVLARAAFWEG